MNASYTIIDLPQGTPEWRAWRHGGIGASEASTVLGENPFKSAEQLLREKRGPVQNFTPNAKMALGTRLEPEARSRYIARIGKEFRPVCLQSTLYPWLRASLDGLAISDGAAVEIKCGESAYRKTSTSRSVPIYYYAQLQHILAVTNLRKIDFWCYWPGCLEVLIEVKRADDYINRMLQKHQTFWNAVQRP
jgi:putative phage-type endonuclease